MTKISTFLDFFALTLDISIKDRFTTSIAKNTDFLHFSLIYVTIVTKFNPSNSFKFIFVVSQATIKMI